MRNILFAFSVVILSFAPCFAQTPEPEKITWKTPANNYREYIGEKFAFRCPKGGEISDQLWGTDIYSDDSSICTAASHSGLISLDAGGVVTIEIRPGQERYKGSKRNGIESYDYATWPGSFIFVKSEEAGGEEVQSAENSDDANATDITWTKTSKSLNSKVGDRLTLRCPKNGDVGHRVWGTDIYTDDSSVCVAAVHSGLINLGGGVVTIEIRPGEKKYVGSRRNKVISEPYGSWTGSFIFIKPAK